ncbi:MAG: hypothetical protein EA427_13905 [Spirochaetaceae bacterium]|nr:MAG: hypothetical protein EA427_13905 [Spirochaetaceae bacterium]
MKLKTVFVLFNAIVVTTFLLVFLMPVFFLGIEFSTIFWRSNWYLAVLFVLVLLILNSYFAINWPLFSALENENWREIADVLEKRIRTRGRYSESNMRLLLNAYVVSGSTGKIQELEEHLRTRKPDVLEHHALRFGIPHLLSNDGKQIERYFAEFRRPGGAGDGAVSTRRRGKSDKVYWVEWGYAFGLLLQERLDEGRTILQQIVKSAPAGIVRALALYLLAPHSEQEKTGDSDTEAARRDLVRELPREAWEKQLERERAELHILVLSRLLRDVEEWLYQPDTKDSPDAEA